MSTRPPLAAFAGTWRIARRIRDRHAGVTARFEGTLTFSPHGASLIAVETGRLHLPGQGALTAGQRQIWRAEGHFIAVDFADGRPFHEIAPGPRPRARHHCPPDLYQGLYDFTRWPLWRLLWRVNGPRKRQTILSRLVPEN